MSSTKVAETRYRDRKGPFRVGDDVKFRYVTRDVIGRVVEDRGSIGFQGRRLYRVEADEDGILLVLKLPAGDLVKVPNP